MQGLCTTAEDSSMVELGEILREAWCNTYIMCIRYDILWWGMYDALLEDISIFKLYAMFMSISTCL